MSILTRVAPLLQDSQIVQVRIRESSLDVNLKKIGVMVFLKFLKLAFGDFGVALADFRQFSSRESLLYSTPVCKPGPIRKVGFPENLLQISRSYSESQATISAQSSRDIGRLGAQVLSVPVRPTSKHVEH